jgi:hypothetical protein
VHVNEYTCELCLQFMIFQEVTLRLQDGAEVPRSRAHIAVLGLRASVARVRLHYWLGVARGVSCAHGRSQVHTVFLCQYCAGIMSIWHNHVVDILHIMVV